MDVDTKVNGLIIIWKAQASIFGMMVECTKASIKTIKNMDMEFTLGLMVAVTKDIGTEANNMVWVLTWFLKMEKLNMVFGRMASVSNGLTKDR